MVARHGSRVALLDASGAELQNPGRREPHYLLDALALKAAGAKVGPRTWTFAGTNPTSDWTPPRRSMALALAASWRFHLIVAFVLGAMAVGLSTSKRKAQPASPPNARRSRWSLGAIGAAAFVPLLLNVLAGPFLSAFLLYHLGQSGARGGDGLARQRDPVYQPQRGGLCVLLRTVNGRLVKTGFRDDDFNVRAATPSATRTRERCSLPLAAPVPQPLRHCRRRRQPLGEPPAVRRRRSAAHEITPRR